MTPKPPPVPSTWRRLRAWFRPPRTLKISRTGRTYLVVTLGVGIGALNTGNNLLYLVLGLLLSLIVVSGILSERVLRGLAVRRLGADAAWAGEPFAFRWALSKKGGAAFALTLSEVGDALSATGSAAIVEPGQEVVVRADAMAPRRGPLPLTGVRVTTTFPFGLFAKTREYDLTETLLVYPRKVQARATPPSAEAGPLGDVGDPSRGDGSGDLFGLKELQDGEDARRVHWLKSAAAGRLIKTLRERDERRTYLLAVPQGEGARLDPLCEELAATAQRLLDQGHEVGLESNVAKLRPGSGAAQKRRILQALAWAGYEDQR